MWLQFNRLVATAHKQMPLSRELIFHGIAPDGTPLPQGLTAFHLILWKFVIFNFTLVQTDNIKFMPEAVWDQSLRRFEVRVNALAAKVTLQAVRSRGQGNSPMEPRSENKKLEPLASLDAWGRLTLSPSLKQAFADSRPTVVPATTPTT